MHPVIIGQNSPKVPPSAILFSVLPKFFCAQMPPFVTTIGLGKLRYGHISQTAGSPIEFVTHSQKKQQLAQESLVLAFPQYENSENAAQITQLWRFTITYQRCLLP
jgi:hypothetical protein